MFDHRSTEDETTSTAPHHGEEAHSDEGFAGHLASGFIGTGALAHFLHGPAEHLAHGAGEEVAHLEKMRAVPEPAVWNKMVDPAAHPAWLESMPEAHRPAAPFWSSPAQREAMLHESDLAHDEARLEMPGAEAKASRWGNASRALGIGAAVGEGVEEYRESTAQTTAGKTIDATAAGGIALGVNAVPGLALADTVTGMGGMALRGLGHIGGSETLTHAGEWLGENKPSHQLIGGARGAVTAAEGLATGDSTGMRDVHQEQLAGKQGWLLRQAAQAGDFWAGPNVGKQLASSASDAWHSLFGHYAD